MWIRAFFQCCRNTILIISFNVLINGTFQIRRPRRSCLRWVKKGIRDGTFGSFGIFGTFGTFGTFSTFGTFLCIITIWKIIEILVLIIFENLLPIFYQCLNRTKQKMILFRHGEADDQLEKLLPGVV